MWHSHLPEEEPEGKGQGGLVGYATVSMTQETLSSWSACTSPPMTWRTPAPHHARFRMGLSRFA